MLDPSTKKEHGKRSELEMSIVINYPYIVALVFPVYFLSSCAFLMFHWYLVIKYVMKLPSIF